MFCVTFSGDPDPRQLNPTSQAREILNKIKPDLALQAAVSHYLQAVRANGGVQPHHSLVKYIITEDFRSCYEDISTF